MSKSGQNYLALTSDDMGAPLWQPMTPDEIEAAQRSYDTERALEQATTAQLQAELEKRGYVNGVLVHPELDR